MTDLCDQYVEVRCPDPPHRLFMKLLQRGERPRVTKDNLMEFGCHDCKRRARGEQDPVSLVLHRFSLLGEFVETEVVHESGRSVLR